MEDTEEYQSLIIIKSANLMVMSEVMEAIQKYLKKNHKVSNAIIQNTPEGFYEVLVKK